MVDKVLESFSLTRDDSVLEGDIDTLRKFGFNENEIKTVTKDKYGHLILERVAVVDIIKYFLTRAFKTIRIENHPHLWIIKIIFSVEKETRLDLSLN